KAIYEIVLENMKRVFMNVNLFEEQFAKKQMESYGEEKKKELLEKRKELNKAKKRVSEIDNLIQRIYEDNASGKLSDERYATMSMAYEKEQQELKESIPIMEEYLSTETNKTENLQRFIDKVKRITEIKELTPELIHEFIEKIVVSSPRYFDGKRYQIVDIYYNGIGIIRGLTPEDMEESFERELEQKQKEKTA
ncbi:MAG: DUF4368 domain-containing protein, partial [Oscillospiraceae bacterium]|nr:DUF4368 domain-containing protein [Oscillospiraceae bacterium]